MISSQGKPISWNTHALLTRAALHSERLSLLDSRFPVVRLEDFLVQARGHLQLVVKWYWGLLGRKSGIPSPAWEPPPEIADEESFIRAFRLNPCMQFHYIKVLQANEVPRETPHDPSREGPPGGAYMETGCDGSLRGRDVLEAYSDEPDWGMDQDLFAISDYGYGPCPFGPPTGPSSQAPFHMALLNENPLLTAVVPRLKRTFVEERIRVFFALARLAFNRGIHYWGWRFTAWAMHYLQDLTQPYHARAFPFSLFRILRRAVLAGGFSRLAEKNKNLLRNRHLLYEAAVHFVLNDAFKNWTNHPMIFSLAGDGDAATGTIGSVIRQTARFSASLARLTDQAIVGLMRDPRIQDPAYFIGDDHWYRIDDALPHAGYKRPGEYQRFMQVTCACLARTGQVTRFALRHIEDIQGNGPSASIQHDRMVIPDNRTTKTQRHEVN